MMRNALRLAGFSGVSLAAAAAALLLMEPAAQAQDGGAGPDKAAVEKIVRDYLLANPEILNEMQATLEAKQQQERQQAAVATIKSAGPEIFASAEDGVIGNPQAKKTVVEFFDYNCGYCRHALADMQAMTAADPDLRFVLKEFPILGQESQKAHVVSMAFKALMPEKYAEFHEKLLGGSGRASEAAAIKVALELGADEAKLREAMKDPAIAAAFEKTYSLADRLQISGTPSYVVGNEIVYGAMGKDALTATVAEAVAACGDSTNC